MVFETHKQWRWASEPLHVEGVAVFRGGFVVRAGLPRRASAHLGPSLRISPRDYLVNVEMKVVIKGMKLIAQRVAETIARHLPLGEHSSGQLQPSGPTTCARWTRESTADTFGLAIIPIPSTPGASAPLSKPTGTIRPTILMTPDCIASSMAKAGVCWLGTLTLEATWS